MRTTDYTDDELETKDRWDKLFWIEIAKRKERQVTGDAQRMLIRLHDEIALFFDRSGQELDEPIDGREGATALLIAFQWRSNPADNAYDQAQADLYLKAMAHFERRIREVASKLQYARGFRLADLAVENDIETMWGWWVYVNSNAGRKEMGVGKGIFSSRREPVKTVDEDDPTLTIVTMTSYARPGQPPIPVTNRGIDTFASDADSIVINGHSVTDSMVIVLDLNHPLPSMRELENAAYMGIGKVQARRIDAAMERGDLAELQQLLDQGSRPLKFTQFLTPPEEHQLFKAQNSVAPILRGLYAWDLVHNLDLSDAEASRETSRVLSGFNTTPKNVINALNSIRSKIDKYEPENLPWLW